MKKSIRALTAWLLFICIVLGAFAPMTASAAAKDWAGYDCVAYARARFAEY